MQIGDIHIRGEVPKEVEKKMRKLIEEGKEEEAVEVLKKEEVKS